MCQAISSLYVLKQKNDVLLFEEEDKTKKKTDKRTLKYGDKN